ncbi:hypothetical protein CIHG_01620 [Coccidioides immitis H538.4]|uniref:Uncharacterized protein n=2 Tax=Coccidioides immitis TaxID=5501 RepID=A0A0J8RAS1_COCIT|nr:hypothetical protein CISG_09183 [Coccidioides immitis RMSCC 3703]KMU83835.1 hypothetical protein CIHG_01620 [Coccidioides immitis H538.4]
MRLERSGHKAAAQREDGYYELLDWITWGAAEAVEGWLEADVMWPCMPSRHVDRRPPTTRGEEEGRPHPACSPSVLPSDLALYDLSTFAYRYPVPRDVPITTIASYLSKLHPLPPPFLERSACGPGTAFIP